jgi:hypothetical protein
MGFKHILNKLAQRPDMERVRGKGLTSDEVELMFFKERERLEGVKHDLKRFRQIESNRIIMGDSMASGSSVLEAKDVFKGNKQKIMDSTKQRKHNSILSINKGKSLLGGKR